MGRAGRGGAVCELLPTPLSLLLPAPPALAPLLLRGPLSSSRPSTSSPAAALASGTPSARIWKLADWLEAVQHTPGQSALSELERSCTVFRPESAVAAEESAAERRPGGGIAGEGPAADAPATPAPATPQPGTPGTHHPGTRHPAPRHPPPRHPPPRHPPPALDGSGGRAGKAAEEEVTLGSRRPREQDRQTARQPCPRRAERPTPCPPAREGVTRCASQESLRAVPCCGAV